MFNFRLHPSFLSICLPACKAVVLTLSIFLALLIFKSCKVQTEAEHPNVVIILTDDQGWGDLGIHGNTNLSTPNIDAISKEGSSLTNFYVCSVCSPTRAEFLTGRYHFRGGVYNTGGGGERLDMDEKTLGEVFRSAGYRTAAYGKWHNGMQYPYHPNGRGFEDFYGFCSGHWGNYHSPMLEHNSRIVKGEGFIIDDLTNHGLQFIEDHQDEPFFLYLPFNTPHTPLQAPEEFWERFRDRPIDMQSDSKHENLIETRAALAMVENIDWNVGRITARLKELGLEENTIVIFFCDNGPNLWRWNGGMKGKKGSVDEGGLRSPFFIKWPAEIPSGHHSPQLASVTDLLPTLADLCNIPFTEDPSHPLDGISLKNTLLNTDKELLTAKGMEDGEERYLLNHWREKISIRSQQYRLSNDGGLYDITNDRAQKTDLSELLPDIKARMQEVADSYRQEINTELPEVDNRPFYLGHPEQKFTQIPARDGRAHGSIVRSNRFPNCSFFTHWTLPSDSITWDVEVPEPGEFRVTLYYTCPERDTGSKVRLSIGDASLDFQISEAHDPPLKGMDEDLAPRQESYVKDWKAIELGVINLNQGKALMSLKAIDIPGQSVMDFRLFLFEKL